MSLEAIPNTIFRPFVEKLGATEITEFIGNEGEIFYDPEGGGLRLSDGSTPGGVPFGESGDISNITAGIGLTGGGNTGDVVIALDRASGAGLGGIVLGDIDGSLLPSATLSFDLGSETRRWRDIYLSGNTIFLGISSITTNPEDGGIGLGTVAYIGENKLTYMEDIGALELGTKVMVGQTVIEDEENGFTGISSLSANLGIITEFIGGADENVIINSSGVTLTSGVFTGDGSGLTNVPGGGGGNPGGDNTQLQFNNNGAFGGASGVTFDGTILSLSPTTRFSGTGDAILEPGDGAGVGRKLELNAGTSTDNNTGGQLILESGFSVGGTTGTGGLLTLKSGEGATSGNIEIETGDSDNTGNLIIQTGEANGVAGTIFLRGGEQQGILRASDVSISGGNNIGSGDGGNVTISGGQVAGAGSTGVVLIRDINVASVNPDYGVLEDTDLATKKYVDDNAGGGVERIDGTDGIIVDPSPGVGVVTISLANSPITRLAAGNNITLEPSNGQPDPTGVVTITAVGGGTTTTPGGSDTQIQFNNNGEFAGNNNLVWFDSIDTLEVNKIRGKSSEDMIIGTVDHLLTASGDLQLITGDSSIAPAGHILVQPGSSGGSSGNVGVTTISGGQGTSDSLRGGEVTVKGGDGDYGGDVTIKGGEASAGDSDQSKTGRVFVENPILKGVADNGRFTFQYVDNIDTTAILYIDDVNDPTGYVSGSAKIFLQGAVENGDSTSRQFVELTVVRFGNIFEVAETHNIKAPSSGQTIFTYTVDDGGVDRRFGVNITNASGQSSITVKAAFVKFLA